MKVYNTRSVSLTIDVLLITILLLLLLLLLLLRFFFSRPLKCSLVSKKSTLSSDRIRGLTRSGKALNRIDLS